MVGSVYGGLLVGGASQRMGSPKALLPFGGGTFFSRARAALAPVVHEVVVLGAGPVPRGHETLRRLPDARDARGPLAGMLAAFALVPGAAWIFLACDLPLATAEAARWLLAERRDASWAVLPRLRPDAIEPLFALYEPAALPHLRSLAAGSGTLQPLAGIAGAHTPSPPERLRRCWRNVNTPDDLLKLTAPEPEP